MGKSTPSVFLPFLNAKTLDYLFDNQAFVDLYRLSILSHFQYFLHQNLKLDLTE
jgi:hypothetical protein